MENHYEVIVVGAGSMGMAAGYYLAKKGVKTLLIDSYDPPHHHGSHHGDTRIIRFAYGEGDYYIPLLKRARELWEELQEQSQQTLFSQTGVLSVGHLDSTFVQEAIHNARKHCVPHEVFSTEDIHIKWPGITLPEGYIGCYEDQAGVLFSEECIRALQKLALSQGAALLPNTRVKEIKTGINEVEVETENGTFYGNGIIITAGAWSKEVLATLNVTLPLDIMRKTVAWTNANESLFNSSVFPAFTLDVPEGHYYGFPSIDGCGVKVGRHDGGRKVQPGIETPEFGAFTEDEHDTKNFLRRYMPEAAGKTKAGKVCYYSNTPDENFIIDRHPEFSNVAIASGFSGHGFKFSTIVGEILSDLVLDKSTDFDLSAFSIKRFSI
ncbi:N-methyl-L-tryptophan oxidase [Aneurinibacillus tyrosinisolvens]|uniref:N-methyl-L-tryptophan oxidase n=1 Tax=Aneurinibacillus tyrosinisolvens TaxID=1443435 RepID=UPI00063EFCE7|nr:N-methyl-L-tryptophan oxidase [Aneurinibacillus tyrosinisolvens]